MANIEQILRNQRTELYDVDFTSYVTYREEKEIDLSSQLAQIVIGVRRSGKSTLCQKVLVESGVKFAYVNCDDETIVEISIKKRDFDIFSCSPQKKVLPLQPKK